MLIILLWLFANAAKELKQYLKTLTLLLFAMNCNFNKGVEVPVFLLQNLHRNMLLLISRL